MLTGLVNDGLVDVQAETVSAGGRTTEIERVIITATGRRAIESTTECGSTIDLCRRRFRRSLWSSRGSP